MWTEILILVLSFIIERVWDTYKHKTTRWDLKEQLMREIDYNCKSGVGSAECPFVLDVHISFSKEKALDRESNLLLSEIIDNARLCNSYGGKRTLAMNPGGVKEQSKNLKDRLITIKFWHI